MIRLTVTAGIVWLVVAPQSHSAPPTPPLTPPMPPLQDCVRPTMSRAQMNSCAERHVADADARLDKVYRMFIKSTERDLKAKFIASQRTWLAFRRANCAFFGAGNGSLARVNELSCLARSTDARTDELGTWPPVPELSDLPHGHR